MQPSRARHKLLAFTTILAIITYLDRVAISSAAPEVRSEMGLSAVQMGWVFSAFTWAYASWDNALRGVPGHLSRRWEVHGVGRGALDVRGGEGGGDVKTEVAA